MLDKNISLNNFINSLSIQNFRNHENLEIITKKPSVVIYGKNGVGKTSILEALSIFTNGKGLRNSKLIEMIKVEEDMFCISVNIKIDDNIFLELRSTYSKSKNKRKIFINGKEKKSFKNIKTNFPMLWITPYDEKIFGGTSSSRRNFLDRIIANFDLDHTKRINEYNKLLKQRSKILKENDDDKDWLNVIEDQLSKLSVAISSTRLDIISRLINFLQNKSIGFPNLRLEFLDSIENKLLSKPALEIEKELKENYFKSRKIDAIIGGSLYGCQKTELFCFNLEKNMPADMCSSGEQKLLLISIILACAKALKESKKIPPIMLLDEVFTHLDSSKKIILFDKLIDLGSQIWITTTETDSFLKKYDNVHYYELKRE